MLRTPRSLWHLLAAACVLVAGNPRPAHSQTARPIGHAAVNVFESARMDSSAFTGTRIGWGAAFTQQFQALRHSNAAAPDTAGGIDRNALIPIGNGFNNAVANLYLSADLAPGMRVAVTSYLSSRHHDESWVKDGYLLIDGSPIDNAALKRLMSNVTLRVGHFEINYGDAHFRRTDNGNAIANPLVGNYIMDAFTTEIGGEAYYRRNGWIAMAGMTGGEVHGQVTRPHDRAPSYLGKLGVDRQVRPDLRVRLTGSIYTTAKSVNNTLYSGDRAGSRYYDVLENVSSTETAQAWSGAIQPGFRSKVTAVVVNPFIAIKHLELFGNIETATGRAATETSSRTWHQNVGEAVYRFLPGDKLYVAARYNTAKGRLAGIAGDVSVNRSQLGGGWFLTQNVLLKTEWVRQIYHDFPVTDIRSGGQFKGMMVEGVVAF